MAYRTGTTCDFMSINVNEEVISRLIARLPESMESGPQGYHAVLLGLEVGGLTAECLKKLHQFGPVIPYCSNGTHMVQVDMYTDGEVHFWSPWKACSGHEGRIIIRSMFGRFTFLFRVVESTAAGVELELHRLLPVTTQDVFIDVEGAGRAVRGPLEILRYLLPSFAEEVWGQQFFRTVNKAFYMIRE
ncbi:uncharacterized protein LOC119168058 [Rhipicephalus microplus]|uniref:uncharacterized protein LOC119168058 n=1 Tax=Rhipicephalus microplus TaxID=6941 RepID=UPI003F6BDD8E